MEAEKPEAGPFIHWRDMPPDVRKQHLGVWATIVSGLLVYVFWIVADRAPVWVTIAALAGPPLVGIIVVVGIVVRIRWVASRMADRRDATRTSG